MPTSNFLAGCSNSRKSVINSYRCAVSLISSRFPMDEHQQQQLLERLADRKNSTKKQIISALKGKDNIIDSLSFRAQVADQLQEHCKQLEADLHTEKSQCQKLEQVLQQRQRQIEYLERLYNNFEHQLECRTQQADIYRNKWLSTKEKMEETYEIQKNGHLMEMTRLKNDLSLMKEKYFAEKLVVNRLDEELQVLAEDKAQLINYYEEKITSLEEQLQRERESNKAKLQDYQQQLKEKQELIEELRNEYEALDKANRQQSQEWQGYKKHMKANGREKQQSNTIRKHANFTDNTFQPLTATTETTESFQTPARTETTRMAVENELQDGTLQNENTSVELQQPWTRFVDTEQRQESVTEPELPQGDNTSKENDPNNNKLLCASDVQEKSSKKKAKSPPSRDARNNLPAYTQREASSESDDNISQRKRKRKTETKQRRVKKSEDPSKNVTKNASFGLYSLEKETMKDSFVAAPLPSTLTASSFRLPQLAFSMSKDGKVVFDAFKKA
eukprot:jgi/Galph1/794/GphlegSOOS_G5579.1